MVGVWCDISAMSLRPYIHTGTLHKF